MALDDVEGQAQAVGQLRAALRSGRLPHAFLFLGSAGTGRLSLARELAGVLLCPEAEEPDESCGRCSDCRLLKAGSHADYAEAGVPEGRQAFPLQVVRDVQHAASLRPVRAARRVFVMRDAERLTDEAANAFLKTLEEPPGGCVFVLIASSLRQIPETVISRCRLVRFANVSPDELGRRLEAQGFEADEAYWLARRCWGAPGLAEQLGRDGLHEVNRELIGRLQAASPEDNLALSDWFGERAAAFPGVPVREALQEMLECVVVYYRDLALLAAAPQGSCPVVNRGAEEGLRARSAGARPEAFLERADIVQETIEMIGANAQARPALDRMFTLLLCAAEPPA